MDNKKKILIKIILIIALISVSYIVTTLFLANIPFGIALPFGWHGENYNYDNRGFPFNVISSPHSEHYSSFPGEHPQMIATSLNGLGYSLDFIFCMVLIIYLYKVIKRALRR
jgi:hypothetical protein